MKKVLIVIKLALIVVLMLSAYACMSGYNNATSDNNIYADPLDMTMGEYFHEKKLYIPESILKETNMPDNIKKKIYGYVIKHKVHTILSARRHSMVESIRDTEMFSFEGIYYIFTDYPDDVKQALVS